MKLKICSVYDSKVNAYMQPFFCRTTGEATRLWTDTVNDPKTQFFQHPGDFTLMELGVYDEESGRIEMNDAYNNLGTAMQYKKDQQ